MQYFLCKEQIPVDLPILSSYKYEENYYHLLDVIDNKEGKKVDQKLENTFTELPTHFIVYRDHPSRKGLVEKRRKTGDIIFNQRNSQGKMYHIFTSDPIFIQKAGKCDRRKSKIMLLEDIKFNFAPFKKRALTLVSRLKNILIFDRNNVYMRLAKRLPENFVSIKIEKISIREGVSLTFPQHLQTETNRQYDFLYLDQKYVFLISNIESYNARPYDTYNGKSIQKFAEDLYTSRSCTFWALKPLLGKDVARLIAEMSFNSQAIV